MSEHQTENDYTPTNVTHFPGPGGLFGAAAFCGTSYATHALRQSSVIVDVDCVVCLALLGDAAMVAALIEGEDGACNAVVNKSEVACPIEGHDHTMAECDGRIDQSSPPSQV